MKNNKLDPTTMADWEIAEAAVLLRARLRRGGPAAGLLEALLDAAQALEVLLHLYLCTDGVIDLDKPREYKKPPHKESGELVY